MHYLEHVTFEIEVLGVNGYLKSSFILSVFEEVDTACVVAVFEGCTNVNSANGAKLSGTFRCYREPFGCVMLACLQEGYLSGVELLSNVLTLRTINFDERHLARRPKRF